MNRSTILRRVLLAPPTLRSSLIALPHPFQRQYASSPNVTQTSFWLNLIPKPLRKRSPTAALKEKAKSKEWNPATFYIVIFLLIGSMSMQMISLKMEFATFTRRADAKIGLLKEIIERIKNGEEVDVEGLLGTGDPEREKEWEEVLKEIEEEDTRWEESRKKQPNEKESIFPSSRPAKPPHKEEKASQPEKRNTPSGFY